jgi:hypothetical protein
MSGTVTHDVAQHLNAILRPYINSNYIIKSSDELLLKLENVQIRHGQELLSLDVESLFTNVPVDETINIIIAAVYQHPTMVPPTIQQEVFRELLKICTTSTPFKFNDNTYIQTDGVSMGSPLGPTFADFYMAHLENKLLSQNRISNPCFYVRYVDDILAIFDNKTHVRYFISRLKSNSVLNFTTENMTDNTFHFLDIKLTIQNDGHIITSVYVKPTDKGIYTNFHSQLPNTYKKSVIKTLVNRAIKYSSTWSDFHSEVNRLRQTFVNNSYPQHLIDRIIRDRLDKHMTGTQTESSNDITFYVKLGILSTFRQDEKNLASVVHRHVRSTDPDRKIKLIAYFKPFKLASCFTTRERRDAASRVNVVYRFSCTEAGCNAAYIGYTTNTLLARCKQHRYSSSSIYSHFSFDHHMSPQCKCSN